MNKPLTMMIKETKAKLASVCNESELPLSLLDLIVREIYTEVHSLAERYSLEEEKAYINSLQENDVSLEGDANESE